MPRISRRLGSGGGRPRGAATETTRPCLARSVVERLGAFLGGRYWPLAWRQRDRLGGIRAMSCLAGAESGAGKGPLDAAVERRLEHPDLGDDGGDQIVRCDVESEVHRLGLARRDASAE